MSEQVNRRAFLNRSALAGTALAAGRSRAAEESKSPLAGLPSGPGPHIAKIKALHADWGWPTRKSSRARDMMQVRARNVGALNDSDDPPLAVTIDDRQSQEIVLYEQLHGPIQAVVGFEGSHPAAHQIRRDDQGEQIRRRRSKDQFLQGHDAQHPVLGINHRQCVGIRAELFNDFRKPIARMEDGRLVPRHHELVDTEMGKHRPDEVALVGR
jgi:hypothetical protein